MHGRKKEFISESEAEKVDKSRKIAKYVKMTSTLLDMHQKKLYTDEAFALSEKLLEINSDYYTAFNYRKLLVEHYIGLKPEQKAALLNTELDLTVRCLQKNPKSYCSWQHRLWVIDHGTADLQRELELCSKFLQADARNFHCWDYRGFIVRRLPVQPLNSELEFTREKINQDFSNYSSWHYRSVLIPKVYANAPVAELHRFIDAEFELLKQAFYTDPYDQSPWLYHRWLVGIRTNPARVKALLAASSDSSSFIESKTSADATPLDTSSECHAMLEREYHMCTELLEEEPKCKWALLTSLSLLQYLRGFPASDLASATLPLGSAAFDQHSQMVISRLKELDPMRTNYYSSFAARLKV